jgi:hypothetical protein
MPRELLENHPGGIYRQVIEDIRYSYVEILLICLYVISISCTLLMQQPSNIFDGVYGKVT